MSSIFSKSSLINSGSSLRIAFIYAVFGLLLIFFADILIINYDLSLSNFTFFSIAKGFIFVSITSSIFYLLIRKANKILNEKIALLEKSESLHKLLTDNMNDVIWIYDLEKRKIIYISPSIEKLTGFTPQEVLQLPLNKYLSPASYEYVTKNFEERIRLFNCGNSNTKTTITEIGQYRKDGSIVITESITTLIPDKNGKAIKLVGVSRDITERKQSQEALRQSEQKLIEAMKVAKLGFWEYDIRKDLFVFNDQFYSMMHTSVDEVGTYFLTKKEYADYFLFAEDHEPFLQLIEKTYQIEDKNFTFTGEHPVKYWDGKTGYVSVHLALIKDENNKTIKAYGINQDITDKKLIEIAVKESEQKYRDLYRLSPDAILVHQDEKILFINPAGLKMLGIEAEDQIVGKNIFDIVHENYKSLVLDRIKSMNNTNEPAKPIYEKFLRSDGKTVDVEVTSTPIKINGKVAFQLIARDITERKRVEDQIKASEEKFAKIFNNAPVLITISTFNNPYYIEVNQMFCDVTGYRRDELFSKPLSLLGIITAETRQKINDLIDRNGNARNLLIKLFTKEQTVLECLYYGEVIYVQNEKCLLSIILDITERNKAEELIRESEQKLSALIEATPDLICFKDAEGRWLRANQGMLTVFGLTNVDYKNKTEFELVSYVDSRLSETILSCSITDELAWLKKSPSRTEEVIPDLYGNKRFYDIIKVPLFNDNGTKKALVVFGRDITDRKKSEWELQSEKDKFSKTFFTSPDGLIINTIKESIIIELNDGFIELSGYSREELINKPARAFNFWVEDDIRKISKSVLLAGGTNQNIETKLRRKNGEIVNVLMSSSRVEIDGKECALYLIKNITQLKKTEQALRESEKRYKDLFEHLLDGFAYHELVLDQSGNPVDYIFLAANSRYEALFGLKNEEIIGNTISSIMPSKAKELVQLYSPVAIEGTPKRFESFNEETGLFCRILAYSPEKFKFATVIEDITEKVIAEKELELHRTKLEQLVKLRTLELDKANKKLEEKIQKDKEYEMVLKEALKKEKELNDLKTRFISTASHEFRTPLTSILSSVELIERYRKKWSDDKFDEHFNRVKNSVTYLTDLLNDVLLISRTESGKLSFEPSLVDLKKFCEEDIKEASVHAKPNHKINFSFQTKQRKFLVDKKLLHFILLNLLSNAFKYSPKGGKIEINVKATKMYITITIQDEGIGIPQNELQHLYEPFHRCKLTREIPGTGLGLSIVKRSVDLHHGQINVESTVGIGTCFTVTLPIINMVEKKKNNLRSKQKN